MPLLVVRISDTREKIEGKYCDYIGIQGDSVIIVCCNCLQYQILFLQKRVLTSNENFTCFVLMHSVKKLFLQRKCVMVVFHNV